MDRLYYEAWTFPPFRFLYFNIAQSLAVFYGKNDWHYYLSQGYLLLLTTALPSALIGLYRALYPAPSTNPTTFQASIMRQLAVICILMPLVLSLLSHKEVRFIYPLLPALHILASPTLVKFFLPAISSSSRAYTPGRLLLIFLILVNLTISFYTTVFHASGGPNILSYLRKQYDSHYLSSDIAEIPSQSPYSSLLSPGPIESASKIMTVGFLMPCHSTPWRTHLVFPNIQAWALSCEPPVNLNATEKSSYLDEADQFYADPGAFLRHNMVGGLRHLPRKPSYLQSNNFFRMQNMSSVSGQQPPSNHNWPDYLVFFSQLEPTLHNLLRSSSYAECYRAWNTAWHDDWRRKGDMVVWCLDPSVQREWRENNKLIHKTSWEKAMEKKGKLFDKIVDGFRKESALGWGQTTRSIPLWSRPKWSWSPKSPVQWQDRWQWPWTSRKGGNWLYGKSARVPYWEQLTKIWRRPSKSNRYLWS
jgi:phosphatidylinositol glycan class B